MTKTLANGYSSESAPRELSNEYQHDRVSMVFRKLCIFVLWMKVASALKGLSNPFMLQVDSKYDTFGKALLTRQNFPK